MDADDHAHEELPRYRDWAPTSFDTPGLRAETMGGYAGSPARGYEDADDDIDRSDWLVLPVSQTRDSGALARSNYAAATASLDAVDPGAIDHEDHRFGHWGPGWVEILIVRPHTPCATVAGEILCALADSPVLDEEAYSDLEWEEAAESWRWASVRDRVESCQRHGVSVFAARRDAIPEGCWEDWRGE